jgi:hypothetical protein
MTITRVRNFWRKTTQQFSVFPKLRNSRRFCASFRRFCLMNLRRRKATKSFIILLILECRSSESNFSQMTIHNSGKYSHKTCLISYVAFRRRRRAPFFTIERKSASQVCNEPSSKFAQWILNRLRKIRSPCRSDSENEIRSLKNESSVWRRLYLFILLLIVLKTNSHLYWRIFDIGSISGLRRSIIKARFFLN